jgi:hypothetical protein
MSYSKPIVLFLSLEDCSEQLLKGVHGQLLHTLDDHCTVKLITTKKEARSALEDPRVLVAVANDKMAAVVTKPFLQRGEAAAAVAAASACFRDATALVMQSLSTQCLGSSSHCSCLVAAPLLQPC